MSIPFTKALLDWDLNQNNRPMPWKGEKDPYKIWLSEIILQQTRVEQGWSYYERFIKTYPTIVDLANANDEKLFKLWEGLGYYNRCRNLLFTARHIVHELNGIFPSTYPDLIALKGVGPYTAAAIASFAFNLPYAVVDGNVFRVFARYYGLSTPTDTKEGVTLFNKVAAENLSKKNPGNYNQALMDFGATVCKPMLPLCSICPLQKKCIAFSINKVNQLPVKLKSIQKKNRYFDFYCFQFKDKWLIQKRGPGDIWEGLHQFYLTEQIKLQPIHYQSIVSLLQEQLGVDVSMLAANAPIIFTPYKQQLTHQTIQARFIIIPFNKMPPVFVNALWLNKKQIKALAFPKIINEFLQQDFIKKY